MTARAHAAPLVWCAFVLGCGPQTTRLLVRVAATGAAIGSLSIEAVLDGEAGGTFQLLPKGGGPPQLPGNVLLTFEDISTGVTVKLAALDVNGDPRVTSGRAQITRYRQAELALLLDGASAPGVPASDPPRWLPAASLAQPRVGLAAATGPDGRIYAIGGTTGIDYLSTVEAYSPERDIWSPAKDLSVARGNMAATSTTDPGGRIYIVGGLGANGPVRLTESYRPDVWQAEPDLNVARFGAGGVVTSNQTLFVAGGATSNPTLVPQVERLIRGDQWTELAMSDIPTSRNYLGVALGPDGATMYAIGGETDYVLGCCAGNAQSTVEALNLATQEWSAVQPLGSARTRLAAVVAPDRRIYAIGGADGSGARMAEVTAYDAQTNSWAAVSALTSARGGAGAAVGPDGRIYAIAGLGISEELSSVEVYGPVMALSRSAAPLGTPVTAAGSNFAANANVVAAAVPSMFVVGSGHTDGSGALAAPIQVTAPAGTTAIRLVDDQSRFPVTARLVIE